MDTIGISPLHRVAHAALACLWRDGTRAREIGLSDGTVARIAYRGPAVPRALPDALADYEMVRTQPPSWEGAHRLVIRAPLVVFDLAWNTDEPVRILVYCRGDWEGELLEALK